MKVAASSCGVQIWLEATSRRHQLPPWDKLRSSRKESVTIPYPTILDDTNCQAAAIHTIIRGQNSPEPGPAPHTHVFPHLIFCPGPPRLAASLSSRATLRQSQFQTPVGSGLDDMPVRMNWSKRCDSIDYYGEMYLCVISTRLVASHNCRG